MKKILSILLLLSLSVSALVNARRGSGHGGRYHGRRRSYDRYYRGWGYPYYWGYPYGYYGYPYYGYPYYGRPGVGFSVGGPGAGFSIGFRA